MFGSTREKTVTMGLAVWVVGSGIVVAQEAPRHNVPGVVIRYTPAQSGVYVGSPGIAVLPNGDYLAKCDDFGPKTTEHQSAVTRVFRSADRGQTWSQIACIDGLFWASVFVHRDQVYLLGTRKHYGQTVILRSADGGRTWTQPKDKDTGILLPEEMYHCAPVPVVVHNGRLWRAMEDITPPRKWGQCFRAFMMSAPVDADLLRADSWSVSNRIGRNAQWLDGKFGGWLEGNAVVTPAGKVVNILRVEHPSFDEKAAIIEINDDGKQAAFDPKTGFIGFPGGAKKFTIRFDPQGKKYWSLSNDVPAEYRDVLRPAQTRNTLALICSDDLRHWTVRAVVLQHPDVKKHGFQYVDWLFEGNDIIAAVRTAYDDGIGGAHNQHDANYLTFHRIECFRELKK